MNITARVPFWTGFQPYSKRLSYLESTSGQYFSLPASELPTTGASFEWKAQVTSSSAQTWESAGWTWYQDEQSQCVRVIRNSTSTSSVLAYFFVTAGGGGTNISTTIGQSHEYTLSLRQAKVDGKTYALNAPSGNANKKAITLFSSNSARKVRMWYWRWFENGVLVHDLIPVLDLKKKPAMYDLVTKKFYYNQGNGEFGIGLKGQSIVSALKRILLKLACRKEAAE